jgi:hypothetical protein
MELTENEIPDVLTRSIWPSGNLKAFRQGDTITITTDWVAGQTVEDGRAVTDAAQTICGQTINDLLSTDDVPTHIRVLAADGTTRLAYKDGDFEICRAGP